MCKNPARLVARATKFCPVAPNIYGIIIAVFFLDAKMCITSHAPSGKRQVTVRLKVVSGFWAFNLELDSYRLSGARDLDVASSILEYL